MSIGDTLEVLDRNTRLSQEPRGLGQARGTSCVSGLHPR